MQPDRLRDLLADGQHRIQGRHRLLKDHGDPVPPNPADGTLAQLQQILAVEEDTSAVDGSRIAEQAQDGQSRHALARAALADDGEGFAGTHLQRDALHGAHDAPVRTKGDRQVLDCE